MDLLIYSICLGVGLLFTVVSAVSAHLFGGHDADTTLGTGGHAEAGFEHTGMPGISPFSPTMIAAFVTSFGALGIIFSKIEATSKPYVSAPLSAVGGVLIAAGVFALFHKFFSATQSSSESHVASLTGLTATIITPIPENGVGEIAYVQAGSRYTAGQAVRIARTVGSQFYVEPTV
jgi:membrane-bound ClpP family serine protease